MSEQLIKAIQQRNQLVNIKYVVKEDSLTKWRVKVIGIFGYLTFLISNVPVIIPFVYKEREMYEL